MPMRMSGPCKYLAMLLLLISSRAPVGAQTPAAQPDIMILNDGERVLGHLEHSTATTVTFKSDMLGEVSVDWSKVKEMHTSGKSAVIAKGAKLKTRQDAASVSVGAASVQEQTVQFSQTTKPA